MGNSNQQAGESRKSGTMRRLVIMLGLFGILAGGIWGGRQYLESMKPKGDKDFAKLRNDDEPDEPAPTGMEVLGEIFGAKKPSKEIAELQEKSADEVAFTYDAIMKMSPEALEKNIQEVSDRLIKFRGNLAPSIAGAVAGAAPDNTGDDAEEKSTVTVMSLALPLEVMRQVARAKK